MKFKSNSKTTDRDKAFYKTQALFDNQSYQIALERPPRPHQTATAQTSGRRVNFDIAEDSDSTCAGGGHFENFQAQVQNLERSVTQDMVVQSLQKEISQMKARMPKEQSIIEMRARIATILKQISEVENQKIKRRTEAEHVIQMQNGKIDQLKLKLTQYNKKLEYANINGSSLTIRMNKYEATELLIKKSLHEA